MKKSVGSSKYLATQMHICKVVVQLHQMWIFDSKANRCISTKMKL
jgi:hypothetical protein